MDTHKSPQDNHPPAPEGEKLHAVLLQPPPGDLTGPYPALAYLKASACKAGHNVRTRDLGIEALHFLAQVSRVRGLLEQARTLRERLEAEPALGPAALNQYALLVSSVGLGLKPELIGDAMNVLKDKVKFYDYRRYRKACRLLESFYRMLSAVHYPTRVSASEYPTILQAPDFESVMTHRLRSLNPYIDYYEEVLFPWISEANPAVAAISMVFASQSVQALVLGRLIKERFPQVHVVMGGAYLSQWVLLMNDAQLADIFTCADSVVCGEGEEGFAELLNRIADRQSLEGVPNLIYPDGITSRVHRFTTLQYTDLSEQPCPDYSDLDFDAYLAPEPIIPYCISRGCYWGKCAFCQNRYGDHHMRRYQAVPVEKAIEEMSRLAEKHGSNHFNFSNDALDPGYLKRFCTEVRNSGKRFVWNTDLRAEKSFTSDRCKEFKAAGLNSVAIGFESACQKTLDAMDKGYKTDTIRQVMKNFYDAGVATQAMGIFGFPGETEQDAELTVRFLEENTDRISYYVMGLLMVLPGSRLYYDRQKYGITSVTYENNPMMAPEPVWRSDIRMSARAVNNLYDRLSGLEKTYRIDDYPFVGGLSTNHSFLYFRLGPDILKRLQSEMNQRQIRLHRSLSIDDAGLQAKKFKSIVPKLSLPYTVYQSSFPIEQISAHGGTAPGNQPVWPTVKRDYLVDPINMPVPLSPVLLKFLHRVDGHRNLKAIVARLPQVGAQHLLQFLVFLASIDLLEVPGT